jgi:hypothetical protein
MAALLFSLLASVQSHQITAASTLASSSFRQDKLKSIAKSQFINFKSIFNISTKTNKEVTHRGKDCFVSCFPPKF